MAITRLTDIITVFESKWTYGDVKFGYEPDVNQDHDTKYPLMLVEPPVSSIPEINNGREEYTLELNFYNLYPQAAQSVVSLQKRWDNLQDLANEWLDMVLKNYLENSVGVYLNDESIEIERVKDVANDRLVQIKMTFTISAFTKCFRPVSNYPSDFENLVVWLKADSGTTFDISTKKVSAWADQSGNSNSVAQATAANQPTWVGYDGINDKAYINFNGTTEFFTSNGNCPILTDFTIFIVSKFSTNNSVIFFYEKTGSPAIEIGSIQIAPVSGAQKVAVGDGTNNLTLSSSSESALNSPNITTVIKNSKTLTLEYDDATASTTNSTTNSSFDATRTFNHTTFNVGKASTAYMNGEYNELIIYNGVLSAAQISDVKNYLNTKYKIY